MFTLLAKLLRNKRGDITLQTAAVLPILTIMLFGVTEVFLFYFDAQIVNTAMDLALRQAQIDGYFSDAARSVAERELETSFLLRDYTLTGTVEQKEWGEEVEITLTASRTLYIVNEIEIPINKTRRGLSEWFPGMGSIKGIGIFVHGLYTGHHGFKCSPAI